MGRIKKVYIVSGLDFKDGNTPLSDWRLLHRALFDEYKKRVHWDHDVVYEVNLEGTGIKLEKWYGDRFYSTNDKTKLKDLRITAYRIGADHKRLDTVVPCPWDTSQSKGIKNG